MREGFYRIEQGHCGFKTILAIMLNFPSLTYRRITIHVSVKFQSLVELKGVIRKNVLPATIRLAIRIREPR